MFSTVCVFAQTNGELDAFDKKGKPIGECPLKNTNVKAEISGFLSRVKVTQEFENKFTEPIEAVYVFPLPENSAVDSMTMKIGERTIRGKIMKRCETGEVYGTPRKIIDDKTRRNVMGKRKRLAFVAL